MTLLEALRLIRAPLGARGVTDPDRRDAMVVIHGEIRRQVAAKVKPQDREDIVNTMVLKLWRAQSNNPTPLQARDEKGACAYIAQMLRNCVADYYRKSKRERADPSSDTLEDHPSPEAPAGDSDFRELLARGREKLLNDILPAATKGRRRTTSEQLRDTFTYLIRIRDGEGTIAQVTDELCSEEDGQAAWSDMYDRLVQRFKRCRDALFDEISRQSEAAAISPEDREVLSFCLDELKFRRPKERGPGDGPTGEPTKLSERASR